MHTEVTDRSQVRNSAELRRFSSPHPSLFSEFLGSNDKGMAARAYIGHRDPVAPEVGDRPLPPFFLNFLAQMRREWRPGLI